MSKTYDNTIDIFADEKLLKKQIMTIVTDSKDLETRRIQIHVIFLIFLN